MAEVLKKFGRYFLLDRIAQGGMAEIYRARMASADTAGRLMVIKRIQSGYGANDEFVTMFKSEIKVTMGFNHPNIVQVYDFGEEANQPYIAMELVDGRNLRQLISRFAELKQSIPIDLAAYVIEQAAAGLYYAHSFKDKISGEPLNIIHRDISPQNILISYEGVVKVIDFGIAKATVNSESTRAGVIKGKPSYLSPEQITGEQLDGRCDIFALGTVLWELLTGKKLFSGENDLAVLKMIESCSSHVKAPSTLNPDVPKELDYIVLKTLAKQREARFQTAEELRRALHKFVYNFNKDFNPSDLSYYAKDLFKGEIVEDRKRIQKLNEKAEILLASGADGEGGTAKVATPQGKREDTTTVFEITNGSSTSSKIRNVKAPGAVSAVVSIEEVPKGPPRARTPVQASEDGGGRKVFVWGGAVATVALVLFGSNFGLEIPPPSRWLDIVFGVKRNPAAEARPQATTPSATQAQATAPNREEAYDKNRFVPLKLNLAGGLGGVTAVLNGKPIDLGSRVLLQMDTTLDLIIEKQGFKPFRREFAIDSKTLGALREYPVDVALEPVSFGYLTIRTTPSSEATLINRDASRTPSDDTKPWTRRTPFENEKVPVGTYNVRMVNEILGMEKVVTIQVQQGKIHTIDTRLELKN